MRLARRASPTNWGILAEAWNTGADVPPVGVRRGDFASPQRCPSFGIPLATIPLPFSFVCPYLTEADTRSLLNHVFICRVRDIPRVAP